MTTIVEGRMIITRIRLKIPPMKGEAIVKPNDDGLKPKPSHEQPEPKECNS